MIRIVRPILVLPVILSALQARGLAEHRLIAVSADGQSATFFFESPSKAYLLSHTNPNIMFRSIVLPRILMVERDRVLVWAQPSKREARGVYLVEPRSAQLIARLDVLRGIWLRGGRSRAEDVLSYGRNVEDPRGRQRFVCNGFSLLLPLGASITDPGLAVYIPGKDRWLRGSLEGTASFALAFPRRKADVCLPVRTVEDDVCVVRVGSQWKICCGGDEYRIDGDVKCAWTSGSGRSFALLVEFPRSVLDFDGLPARKKLLIARVDEMPRVLFDGRFDFNGLCWSTDEESVAACITEYQVLDDGTMRVASIIVTTNDDLLTAPARSVFSDPALDTRGRVIACVQRSAGFDRLVIDDTAGPASVFLWPPTIVGDRMVSVALRGTQIERIEESPSFPRDE